MLRQNSKIITTAMWAFDALLVVFSFFLAWYVKFMLGIFPEEAHLPFSEYLKVLYITLPCFLIFQYAFQLYSSMRTMSVYKEIFQILKSTALLFVMTLGILFFFKKLDISRVFTTLFCAFLFLSVSIQRTALRFFLRVFRQKGFNIKYVILLGLTHQGKSYLSAIERHREMGYQVFGILDDDEKEGSLCHGIKVLGNIYKLDKILDKNFIDEVVIAIPMEKYTQMGYILQTCENAGVKSVIIPGYSDYVPTKPQIDEIDDIPLINTRHIPLDNILWAFVKNTVDFVASLLLLILLSPMFLIFSVVIKLTSEGPVFFKQERVGYNKKPFTMYKFRTMRVDAPSTGWTVKDDPRRTKFGAFLRKTSLDELPQLINVLKGEMSLVGPRPEQKSFVEQFKNTIPKYMIKHRVRPGITGWAQVNGWRGDTSIEERIKYDIYYIENWNIFFDLKILWMTIRFGHKNAY